MYVYIILYIVYRWHFSADFQTSLCTRMYILYIFKIVYSICIYSCRCSAAAANRRASGRV